MIPHPIVKSILSVLLLWTPSLLVCAQSFSGLHQYDEKISHFLGAGQKDSALHLLNEKARLARQADSLALWGQTQVDIHEIFEDDHPKSLAHLNAAWENKWREPKNAAESYPFMLLFANKGWFLSQTGQFWQANQAYTIAAQYWEQNRYADFDVVYSVYKPLGNNYSRLGDNDKAIAVFQKALPIAMHGDPEALSGLFSNIGIAYWNKGDYAVAEAHYRKGLRLSGISTGKRGLLMGRLAETLLDQGRIAEAARTATEAIRLLRPEGPEDHRTLDYRARAHRIAGLANTQLGKIAEAERSLGAALADDLVSSGDISREVGKDHIAFSKLYLQTGRLILAIDAANRALYAVIPACRPLSGNRLSNPKPDQLYEENTIFEALTVKAAAAELLFQKDGSTHWLETALECHELAWQAESILRRVFQYSSSKLNLQKDARAREEAAMHVARLLFEKTGQTVWLEKGFSIAERSKGALLLEALQDNLVRQRLSGSDKRFDELTALRQNLSSFDKKLLLIPTSEQVPQWRIEADVVQGQIATLEQTLRKEYPGLSAFEANPTNMIPIPDDFSSGETLVEYFLSEEWVDIFVFQKDKPGVWNRISNNADLQSLIRRYLAFFGNDYAILNDPAGYFQTAFTLWQKLLPPETAMASKLTILPDGILNFVPFEALLTTMDGTPSLRNAAYLLRKQEVRYGWSLAVLRQQKNLKSSASNYLLSIAPGFVHRERGLAPLVNADFDWRGIEGWDNHNLSGQSADAQHFMKEADGYRVLHFSTHAFAEGNPRIELMDRSLLLPDLYALPLQADLVMLSACETGLGKEEKGEGVMSLARAFAQAGAACIVSSLWSVNDQSTNRLLRYFYDNIGQGKTSGAALREAKLAYLSDAKVGSAAQSPYFWAGLVVVGDDRAIEQPWGWRGLGMLLGVVVLGLMGWLFLQRKH